MGGFWGWGISPHVTKSVGTELCSTLVNWSLVGTVPVCTVHRHIRRKSNIKFFNCIQVGRNLL